MTTPPPPIQIRQSVQADSTDLGGAYANGMFAWHTANEFTLDFLVSAHVPQVAQAPGQNVIEAPQKLVARVRISPGMIFEVIRTINEEMGKYETNFGQIHRPGQDERPAA
jgi:hypothetical protein